MIIDNFTMATYLKAILVVASAKFSLCTIAGLTYMDPIKMRPLPSVNECNPLYWYPRNIPDYCMKTTPQPLPSTSPPPAVVPIAIPAPIPVPLPVPLPIPYNPLLPLPQPFPPMPNPSLQIPIQPPFFPMPPPGPMLPLPGLPSPPLPYPPAYSRQTGLVPGIPGIVSRDGGINIVPFSDVYTNMMEEHKNEMLQKKLQRLYKHYQDYPTRRKHRHGRHNRIKIYSDTNYY